MKISGIKLGKIHASTSGDGHYSKVKVLDIPLLIEVEIGFSNNIIAGYLKAYFDKAFWNVASHDIIYTDKQFEKDVNSGIKNLGYNYDVHYSEQGGQTDDYVHFDIPREFAIDLLEEVFTSYSHSKEFDDMAKFKNERIKSLRSKIKELEELVEKIRVKRIEMIPKG